jgi:SAM-dependent methyltransferase
VSQESPRPFYHKFAWAYDLVIQDDVIRKCTFIAHKLHEQGIENGARILDAGCGTGRYSIALADLGFSVVGVDISDELLAEARKKARPRGASLRFHKGDILELSADNYDAILCRGVLNDLLDDDSRDRAFRSFADALREKGALILDVRDWSPTRDRKRQESSFRRVLETDRGALEFISRTVLDEQRRLLQVRETHTIETGSGRMTYDHDFTMRCWTQAELEESLLDSGFEDIQLFGDYDAKTFLGATDRIVAVAKLGSADGVR